MRRRAADWGPILRRLRAVYRIHSGRWRVPVLRERGGDPFAVLVSTVLSQRTRDEVTERAARRLLARFPSADALAGARLRTVGTMIREVGLSRSKARGLKEAARFLVEHHGGKVPLREAELLAIPRVGPKTAHAILVFGYERPGIPVDTHILRVTRRMGVVKGTTIPQAQRELSLVVPRRYWHLLNPILVQHGMNLCSPRAPRCAECPIEQWCEKIGVPPRAKQAPKG
jgi:endonuclease III